MTPDTRPDDMGFCGVEVGADRALALRVEPLSAQGLAASRFDHGERQGPARLPFCPHCGYDLNLDRPLVIGLAAFDPHTGFSFNETHIDLTASERVIIQTLMKARGSWVSRLVLLERVGSDSVDRTIDVFVKRARAKLRTVGAGDCIETGYGLGYRWRIVGRS